MPKFIIHACSSLLVRPNGIVRYINSVMEMQRKQGHYVVFISDANPTEQMCAAQNAYATNKSLYKPNTKDGHVWLQVDNFIVQQIVEVASAYAGADLVVCHDLHSYLALSQLYSDGIFIQHESDVVNANSRYSYIDDDYLAQQVYAVNNTNWRVGMLAPSNHITPKHPVLTPCPIELAALSKAPKTNGLLYIGDSSDRKGGKEFMAMARELGVTPTIITHDRNTDVFDIGKCYSFNLTQKAAMFSLMKTHKVAYLPSKNECFSLAVMECLQFMPVVVDGQYEWTNGLTDVGVHVETSDGIKNTIKHYLETDIQYDRSKLEAWCSNAEQVWSNLSA